MGKGPGRGVCLIIAVIILAVIVAIIMNHSIGKAQAMQPNADSILLTRLDNYTVEITITPPPPDYASIYGYAILDDELGWQMYLYLDFDRLEHDGTIWTAVYKWAGETNLNAHIPHAGAYCIEDAQVYNVVQNLPICKYLYFTDYLSMLVNAAVR